MVCALRRSGGGVGSGRGPVRPGGSRASLVKPRVMAVVERLNVVREDEQEGIPDHVVMADPEGNEFCVV